MYTTKIWPNWA